MTARLRLAAAAAGPGADRRVAADAPVLLFLPAFDEEAAIADLLRRHPGHGRPAAASSVVVVDDGSTDATAAIARGLGVEVLSLGRQPGPRRGRAGRPAARCRSAAPRPSCSATPTASTRPRRSTASSRRSSPATADYVVGSRFLGRIDHMRPHRRVGNVVLTAGLSFVARRRITDGQSGYRAFSPAAAAAAEVIHDYNYAQVLTLDLLAKGFRYAEVPISYRFRTTGRSFVTLGRYLRHVVPAVYRELQRAHESRPPEDNDVAGPPPHPAAVIG